MASLYILLVCKLIWRILNGQLMIKPIVVVKSLLLDAFYTLKQLAAILNTSEPKVNLQFHRSQFQTNSKDCGVYTLVFVTDLSHGINPAVVSILIPRYLHRKHLAHCLESCQMKPFP